MDLLGLTSIVLYIINSLIFSIFALPLIKDLREIKNRLYKFDFPYVDERTNQHLDKTQREKIKQFDDLTNKYKTFREDLSKVTKFLFYCIFIIIIFSILATYTHTEGHIDATNKGLLIMVATIGLLMYLSLKNIDEFIPPYKKFGDFQYLQNTLNISSQNLVNCAEFRLNIDVPFYSPEKFSEKIPKQISISANIYLHGYKYLFCLLDSQDKLIHQEHGTIEKNTKFTKWHSPFPKINLFGYRHNIGFFNYQKEQQAMKVFLFIFDPCVPGEKNRPLFGSGSIQMSKNLTGATPTKINKLKTFDGIEYFGKRLKFWRLNWIDDATDYLDETIKASLKKAFKKAKLRLQL